MDVIEIELDTIGEAAMDNNQEGHLDTHAGMNFREKMKLFQCQFKDQQPLQKGTTTPKSGPKSGHSQQERSGSLVVKASSSCKETQKTNRPLPSSETPTGNDEQTSETMRYSSSQDSPTGTEKETMTTNESRFHQLEKNFKQELRKEVTEMSSRKGRGWSPDDLEVFKQPLCLISTENVGGREDKLILKSEQEVFEQIKKIDLPLVVVAVVGLYRTGKSYLMNCLANRPKGGFPLGNTIQSKTKGIWVWCKMHPRQDNTVLVLLDTEGLGDVEKGDQNHDNNIFTLATLLCNCLVYNMKGAFDNEAVSKLTFVTEMAKNIRYRGKSSEDNELLNLILPDFVLCVRDFTLELEKDGKTISANEYLETSLAENKVKAAKFNKPRECIRKYFPKRECFPFPLPGDTSVIRNLENLKFSDLCKSFIEATRTFVLYIYDIPPKEMLGSKQINGEMFVTLADRYVTAIKQGVVPDVDDAFTAAAKGENAKTEKEALEIFENQMERVYRPIPENVLRRLYMRAQRAALRYLRQNVVQDLKAECENQVQRIIDELWNAVQEDNKKKVQRLCEETLRDDPLRKCFEKKIRNKDYETSGGNLNFQRDLEILREEYFIVLRDFSENEILWTWLRFITSKKETEARIIEADIILSKKEKEDEQRQHQKRIDTILKKQQKAQQEALEKQKNDLEDHFKKLLKRRDKQLKEEKEKLKAYANYRLEKEAANKEIERLTKEQIERKRFWCMHIREMSPKDKFHNQATHPMVVFGIQEGLSNRKKSNRRN